MERIRKCWTRWKAGTPIRMTEIPRKELMERKKKLKLMRKEHLLRTMPRELKLLLWKAAPRPRLQLLLKTLQDLVNSRSSTLTDLIYR